jgi:[acyl-carrier-protein] S-malonyltransferase
MPLEKLDAVLAEAAQGEVVSAANLNSPDQVVIAGNAAAVARRWNSPRPLEPAERFCCGERSVPCALMKRGAGSAEARSGCDRVSRPECSADQQLASARGPHGAEAREGLFQQVPNPVRWSDSMRALASAGGDAICGGRRGSGAYRAATKHRRNACGVKFGEAADAEKLAT